MDPFTYIRVTKNLGTEVLNLLHRSFYRSEDISVALGIANHEECFPDVDKMVKRQLKQGLSLAAVDTDSDKLVGATITFIDKHSNGEDFYEAQINSTKHPVGRKNLEFTRDVHKFFDIMEFCKVDASVESWVDVVPGYRERGIAKRLTKLTINFAKEMETGNDIRVPIDYEKLEKSFDPPTIFAVISTSEIVAKLLDGLGLKCAAKVSLGGFVYDGLPLSDKIRNKDYLNYYYLRL